MNIIRKISDDLLLSYSRDFNLFILFKSYPQSYKIWLSKIIFPCFQREYTLDYHQTAKKRTKTKLMSIIIIIRVVLVWNFHSSIYVYGIYKRIQKDKGKKRRICKDFALEKIKRLPRHKDATNEIGLLKSCVLPCLYLLPLTFSLLHPYQGVYLGHHPNIF